MTAVRIVPRRCGGMLTQLCGSNGGRSYRCGGGGVARGRAPVGVCGWSAAAGGTPFYKVCVYMYTVYIRLYYGLARTASDRLQNVQSVIFFHKLMLFIIRSIGVVMLVPRP